jgi:hypothetical protein
LCFLHLLKFCSKKIINKKMLIHTSV